MDYDEKMKLDTWSKRTQTNPILSAPAGKIALPVRHSLGDGGSEVEGPVMNLSRRSLGDLCPPKPLGAKDGRQILLYVKRMRQFFERAAGALGDWFAVFFTKPDKQRMVLIEKLRFLWQV